MKRLLCPVFILLAGVLVAFSSLAIAADNTKKSLNKIIAAMPQNFPPHYSIDSSGQPTGFAVDVMNAIAKKAGIEVSYDIKENWRETQGALKSGKAHVIPNLGISIKRKEFAIFTTPLEKFHISIFVSKERTDLKNLADMKGIIVGAVDANVGARLLAKRTDLELRIFATFHEAMLALLSGRVEALAYPESVTWKSSRKMKLDGQIRVLAPPLKTIKRAIAVRKDLPELLKRLQVAMDGFIGSTAYKEIYSKWYDADRPIWTADRFLLIALVIMGLIVVGFAGWPLINRVRANAWAQLAEDGSQATERNEPFRSLTSKLLSIYVPLVTLAAVVLFLYLEFLFYQKERDQLISSLNNVVTIQSPAFQAAAWEYDVDQVRQLLGEFLLLPHIQGAVIYDTAGEVMGQVGDIKTEPEIPEFRVNQTLLSSYQGVKEPIGRLVMTVNSKQIWLRVYEHLQVNAIILLVLLISLITSTLFAVSRVIGRPLLQLRNAIEQTKLESVRTPVQWESGDELGQVVRAYNEMQEKEEAAKNEVREYQENLENLVDERTQELEHKSTLLEAVLGSINQGLVAYDNKLMLIISNKRFQEIRDVPEEMTRPGSAFIDWVRFDAERGEFEDGDPEKVVHQKILQAEKFVAHSFERKRPDGTIIEVEGGPLPNGGFVSTFTNITERKTAEIKLSDAYNVISDSIDYAARIQRSVLPDDALFSSLLSDHFVLWEPRDVVGGDIYWSRMWGDGFLIILGDCTGHGVPGAFMTLIATGALDNALSDVAGGQVAELMQRLHQLVQVTLGQYGEKGESDDGMELGICYVGPDMENMIFVGARFELYLVQDGAISIIKGTKKGIGYHGIPHNQVFEEHEIVNLADKSFYMTSDGLVDQVGGEKNRMFGKKRFRNLLLEIQDQSMKDQRDRLHQSLTEYQGDQTRRDDVAVIGFRVE
ncbi:MAG: transporter substrate-binding domain-containing protein [Rhodospirillaceae bacterium]|jgi:serine phosphatase RsbU (regulator of sigma subunit)/ABC-type amino acid transport substrate-binding protein|nr:transporter substrate-binding domain-containing protein [Rhodospirillaceae bacterium]MBT7485159.1 transporter substrate-binding domain-containing protein [Rhodospirillales bacterium]MBT4699653.1 transporter substrate-binding domain-containing protein [Rhodospirillaceae bacterium]MBT5034264.1 transporter substrate-binding domain-containing protein [Rhodospirillaceae bacterium]MBT6218163.1 transporter substrate-binding domain-containing protein [Rhodospirillaceae bacterium]